ncbi:MAG: GntR family transcriptional regulator, partial [Kiritimatiellae bacterium]|nr:GntR family transcriptional regulator [Kiritimatiellia bacterium]
MPESKSSSRLTRGTHKPRYLYRQLADLIRQDIQSGALEPGDMLPSMDALAEMYDINKATVRQAILDLTAAGLVYAVPAKGTFVSEPRGAEPAGPARSLTVGWVSAVADGGNTGRYHTELIDAVRTAVQEAGGHLILLTAGGHTPDAFCRMVGDARLDGAVIVGPAREDPLRQILGSGLPAVVLDDPYRGIKTDSILVDNEGGGYLAVEHLLGLGHRRLAFISGPTEWDVCRKRLTGAQAAMREAGLDSASARVIESDFSPQGGYAAGLKMLKGKSMPTAAFCFNDEMAAGVLRALYEHSKLRVPADLSVVGFDDVFWTEFTHPPLTTVHVEKELMGRAAVERLQRLIQLEKDRLGKEALARMRKIVTTREHFPTATVTPTTLVIRKSTGPAIR